MREDSRLKILFLIVLAYNIEVFINPIFMNVNIIIPFSFLTYSYFAYKDKNGFTASSSFLIGLFMDLVSGSYIGLNGLIYCMTTYVINSYKYVFRLFSY
ncbi:MAG: rod shape-determining protein MreD, partial [SAR86 cluster bacterium]|nr:rod shape-determining protein MreD [SAR86 cluster bacterium]